MREKKYISREFRKHGCIYFAQLIVTTNHFIFNITKYNINVTLETRTVLKYIFKYLNILEI